MIHTHPSKIAPQPGDRRTNDRTFRGMPTLALLGLLIALLGGGALAQEGLYGPEAPRDTAFVRFFNAGEGNAQAPSLDGEAWEQVAPSTGSPYQPVEPGDHSFAVAGEEISLSLAPESFTTVVLLPQGPLVVEDTALRDISRGLLTFYNLSADDALSLRTADGGEIFTDVAPHSAQSVAIAEAEVGLAVYRGDEEIATIEPQLYRRGEAHSVFYLPGGAEPVVTYLGASAEF